MGRLVIDRIDRKQITHGNQAALDSAIEYLSNWSTRRFSHVTLHNDGPEDIVAAYRIDSKQGTPGYVIGAVWRGESYSFHS